MKGSRASGPRTKPLRVVLYEPSGRGGVCHYTHQLGEHLAKAGAEVTLITTEEYELEHLDRHFRIDTLFRRSWPTRLRGGIARFRRRPAERSGAPGAATASGNASRSADAPGRAGRSFLRQLRIRLLHLRALVGFVRRRPDVVHVQWPVNRSLDAQFLRWLRRLGIPTVYTAHDVEPHSSPEEDRAGLQRLYDAATGIVVHGESNKRELLSIFGVDPSKISVIPHGSFDLLCGPEPLDKAAARRKLGLPPEKKVILFFGLIKRYKGLEYLVEAFRDVRRSDRDAFLLIVGEVFAGDPDGHRYYTRLIDELREEEDVLCVARYVPLEAVGDYLAAADVVALPYTRTYQSGVLLAAYAAGRPVVVTDTGALSETVEEGKSGVVVAPGDAKSLAKGLRDLLADPKRMEEMGEHARYLARTVFAWDTVAERTMELYRSLLAPSAGPGRLLMVTRFL